MSESRRVKVDVANGSMATAWIAGWLFTIGYLKLDFLMGLLGLFVWPYFIGSHFAPAPV